MPCLKVTEILKERALLRQQMEVSLGMARDRGPDSQSEAGTGCFRLILL